MTEKESLHPDGVPMPETPPEASGAVPPPPAPAPDAANLPDLPCDACRDLIPLVQDGAASPVSVQLVGLHIAHCESCRAFWQSGATAAAPNDSQVLGKIRRRLQRLLIAALAAGALVGFWLNSFGYALQYSLIIMPVVGALGYLFLRRRWYFTPLGVALLGFVWHALVMDVAGPVWHILITGLLMYAAIYTALCLMGMLAAKLFVYAFGKEAPDDLHR